MRIVITGGHHTSALPIIEKLQKDAAEGKKSLDISWFGHRHTLKGDKSDTLEYKDITGLGIPFYNLIAGKLYKTYDPIRLLKIPFGFLHAFFLLLKVRPKLIVSFGGYLAVPTVFVGWLLGIPSITHEQTVVAGYANKFISRFVKKIFVSWRASEKYFPKEKVEYVGLPLRPEIFSAASNSLSINPDLKTLYITAGKTGSHKINKTVQAVLGDLLKICNVIHQCGDHSKFSDFDDLTKTYQNLINKEDSLVVPKGKYFLRKFVLKDEIGETFFKADFVLARSGAHITMELLTLKKPSILIPIPWVSHNEQFENAKVLKDAGLGTILEEKNLTPVKLLEKVSQVLRSLDKASPDRKSAAKTERTKETEEIAKVEIPIKDHPTKKIVEEVYKYCS